MVRLFQDDRGAVLTIRFDNHQTFRVWFYVLDVIEDTILSFRFMCENGLTLYASKHLRLAFPKGRPIQNVEQEEFLGLSWSSSDSEGVVLKDSGRAPHQKCHHQPASGTPAADAPRHLATAMTAAAPDGAGRADRECGTVDTAGTGWSGHDDARTDGPWGRRQQCPPNADCHAELTELKDELRGMKAEVAAGEHALWMAQAETTCDDHDDL